MLLSSAKLWRKETQVKKERQTETKKQIFDQDRQIESWEKDKYQIQMDRNYVGKKQQRERKTILHLKE